jgi:hypothetical protein
MVVETGTGGSFTPSPDYETWPENALADGEPVTGLLRVFGIWAVPGMRVRITTRFGWPAVPDPVDEASLIQASRLFKRKDSPEGVAGSSEWGVVRVSRRDPDVWNLIEPYILPASADQEGDPVDIFAVRGAIADAARAVTMPDGTAKLTATGYATDAVTTPHFYVGDYTIDFDKTFKRGQDDIEFTCAVLVSRSDDLSGQKTLDALLSGSGPAQPQDRHRGGPRRARRVRPRRPGRRPARHARAVLPLLRGRDTQYLGAELTVRVIGEGDTS